MKLLKIILLVFVLFFYGCPSDDSIEEDMVIPVAYKLLSFVFTQQTDTNEDALSYEIEFFNPNNFEVKGLPQITITIGGGATSTNAPNAQCRNIPANSSCVLSYSVIDDNPILFPAEPIEFVSADYILE